jgi:hypothetical protein
LNAIKGTCYNKVTINQNGVTTCRWGRHEGVLIPKNKKINSINRTRGSNVSKIINTWHLIGKGKG